jgi:hypothetical protein
VIKPKVYVTEHPLSKTVAKAVLAGTRGHAVPPLELLDGPAICYGILRGCGDIIRKAFNSTQDFYHIDHGYLKRVDWSDSGSLSYGHFRVTKNALSMFGTLPRHTSDTRFKALNVEYKPLSVGRSIVVCELTGLFSQNHPWMKLNKEEWLEGVLRQLRRHTDRPVVVKDKTSGKLTDLLSDAYCLVCHSSNAAIEAAISGVPCIALGESICNQLGPSAIKDIEMVSTIAKSEWEDLRMNVFYTAANNQFTLSELAQEATWDRLLGEATWNGTHQRLK